MLKPGKVHLAFAVSLIMSLSLFTSGAFAAHNVDHTLVKSAVVGKIDSGNTNVTSAFSSTTDDITGATQRFRVGATVYILMTFAGNAGYVKIDTYYNGHLEEGSGAILTVSASQQNGEYSFGLNDEPGNRIVNIYWCTLSDCSDAVLAQSVSFSAS